MPATVSNLVLLIGCGFLLGCGAEPEPKPENVEHKPRRPLVQQSLERPVKNRISALSTRSNGDSELEKENATLRKRVAELEAALEIQQKPAEAVVIDPSQFTHYITEFPPLVSPGSSNIYDEPPAELTTLSADQYRRGAGPLGEEDYTRLLSGEYAFNPSSIPSSDLPVTESTQLQVGQEVQLKWGSTWWAATITGFEPTAW